MKLFLSIVLASLANAGYVVQRGAVCHVHASNDSFDDAPAILSAFDRCGQGGTVALNDELYHIESVMNTTGLRDVSVDLNGTMLVSAPTSDSSIQPGPDVSVGN